MFQALERSNSEVISILAHASAQMRRGSFPSRRWYRVSLGNSRGTLSCFSWFAFLGSFSVELNIVAPLLRHIILIENGFYWAFRNASAAVDAFVGMDVDHIGVFIEAIDWTDL